MSPKKPLRSKLASSVSRSAAALSRATGRGDGAVIGGKIGLMIDPNLLANLASGRQIALISGTNGKTTTTRLTAAALGVLGEVATNSFGANMPTGHTSALAKAGDTPYAVLEVDEHYMPQVIASTAPRVVALLNLSRDQLDRAKEVAMMADLWRTTLAKHPVHVVANADDPMITWAANAVLENGGTVTWVAAGQRWHDDSWVCPNCGAHIERGPHLTPVSPAITAPPSRGGGMFDDVTMVMSSLSAEVTPTQMSVETTVVLPVEAAAARIAAGDSAFGGSASSGDSVVGGSAPGGSASGAEETVLIQSAAAADSSLVSVAPAPLAYDDVTRVLPVAEVPLGPTGQPPVGVAAEAVAVAEQAADLTTDPADDDWHCTNCDLRRPVPSWSVDGDAIIDPTGTR